MADIEGLRAKLSQAQSIASVAEAEYAQLQAAANSSNFAKDANGQIIDQQAFLAARKAASDFRVNNLEPAQSAVSDAELSLTQAQNSDASDARTSVEPTASAAADVKESNDGATQNPAPAPTVAGDDAPRSFQPGALTFDPQGRIIDPNVESGTNPPVITTIESQSINTNAFMPQYGTSEGRPVAGLEAGTPTNDDSGTKQNTGQVVKAAASTVITPRGNALDQYPSYTYNITWYIIEKDVYKTFFNTAKKSLNGMQILMRSGGAPATTAGGSTTGQPGGLGARNNLFDNDYYIDNLELESMLMGPYTRSPHNVTRLKFTVTEPNGITLLNNIWAAVNQVYKTTNLPYSLAQYCLAVRFYAYDQNGNSISGRDNTNTDPNAIIERFYPFYISDIQFRVANKQVEYQVEGLPITHFVGYGQNLGVIKQQVEISGTTVGQALGGQSQGSDPSPPEDGRTTVPQVNVGSGVLEAQAASGTVSTDFTNTQQPNLVSSAVTGIPGVNSSF